ncbi:hypothetical protein [Limosilactobacillus oris]|uniref:hypothetical protein n=1 Tax=Limosilactobacillus oris TaxID=1632 RepID=UPI00388FF074
MTNENPKIYVQTPELYVEATDFEDPYDLRDLAGITATDHNGNDISSSVVINESGIDYETPGDYTVSISASDKDLNIAIEQLIIHVVDPQDEEDGQGDAHDESQRSAKKEHGTMIQSKVLSKKEKHHFWSHNKAKGQRRLSKKADKKTDSKNNTKQEANVRTNQAQSTSKTTLAQTERKKGRRRVKEDDRNGANPNEKQKRPRRNIQRQHPHQQPGKRPNNNHKAGNTPARKRRPLSSIILICSVLLIIVAALVFLGLHIM